MYRQITAEEHKLHFGLDKNYKVDGFLVYGTYKKYPYDIVKQIFLNIDSSTQCKFIDYDFLNPILEIKIGDKNYWFVISYGGALLSEYTHLACIFGSKKNILVGSCGGLKKGGKSGEIIVPSYSFGEESSAKIYQKETNNHPSDEKLSEKLANELKNNGYTVHNEPIITCQAMMGETLEDVLLWSEQGYAGVEMESSTFFAVSNHFNVPASAIIRIGDNLIEKQTVLDEDYKNSKELRRKIMENVLEISISELLKA
jgi:purine-nucleoside phosphorylase